MRKVLFLMFLLLLMGLGAASVKAQVRIGGNTPPNPAAALDLNAAEGTIAGTKGLALPRVTLSSNTATLDGATANITGMLVYNTGGSLSTGVYYWDGTNWNRAVGSRSGLVDTTMLAPVPVNSILIYTAAGWRTASWKLLYTGTLSAGPGYEVNSPSFVISDCIGAINVYPWQADHGATLDGGFSWWLPNQPLSHLTMINTSSVSIGIGFNVSCLKIN